MKRDALITPCGQFRYWLYREWNHTLPKLAFIMLNPSTADADVDDPTIRKCIGFANQYGYGAITVLNLFAYRATDPKELRKAGYPRGPDNDLFIESSLLHEPHTVVCAWGANARGNVRPAEVLGLLKKINTTPHYLKLTADGIPCHPLMLPYSCKITPLEIA